MRSALLALAALLAVPVLARAQEVVRLEVGETMRDVGSVRAMCDAPAVAVIDGGVLRAVGVGETLCAATPFQTQGIRRIYRVIVTAPAPATEKGKGALGRAGAAPAR